MTPADASKLPPELWQPIVEHASNYARTRGTPAAPAHYAKLREALRWAAQFAAIEDEPEAVEQERDLAA
jgi:hypothetical protein